MYCICTMYNVHVHVQIYSTARAELVPKHQVGALGAVFYQWPTTYNYVQAMEKYLYTCTCSRISFKGHQVAPAFGRLMGS